MVPEGETKRKSLGIKQWPQARTVIKGRVHMHHIDPCTVPEIQMPLLMGLTSSSAHPTSAGHAPVCHLVPLPETLFPLLFTWFLQISFQAAPPHGRFLGPVTPNQVPIMDSHSS